MSEPMARLPPPPPFAPARPRDAAAVVLFRRVSSTSAPGGSETEVFWLKRERQLKFAGGFYAFPGGRCDASDAAIPVAGATGLDAALRVTAARELFEETGVLVAVGAEGLDAQTLAQLRRALLDKSLPFDALLGRHGLTLRAQDFIEAGRWLTPDFSPARFDARFFLVEAPAAQRAEVWPGELSEGDWIAPRAALARWEAGSALLHPPNQHAMQVLSVPASVEQWAAQLRAPPRCANFIPWRIEFQRGVRIFPLRTDTLPPATHTNCYVLGNGELLVVDPGTADAGECERLAHMVRELLDEGARVKAVILTHHHGDHASGAERVASLLSAPIWCHEKTADRLPPNLPVARFLVDGEVLELDGVPPMRWRVLHTPGHARGHLCLFDEASRAAVVGDMVAGVGTIVIDPPEGDMAEYLSQLRRLAALGVRALHPAHGPTVVDGEAKLEEYLHHREVREQQVLAALGDAPKSLEAVVEVAYADTPPFLHPLAERSAEAVLLKLVAEGRAVRSEQGYARAQYTTSAEGSK